LIVVGATDANGQRAWFSEFRDGGTGALAVYCIGENVMIPFVGPNNANDVYGMESGTSFAAPLVAGLLSSMMARDATITVDTAKTRLQQVGQSKKGMGWPADMPGAAIVPRMATDTEASCSVPEGQEPEEMFTATWYDWGTQILIDDIPSATLVPLPSYLAFPQVNTGADPVVGVSSPSPSSFSFVYEAVCV
jgi:subtilisin family serine protease